MTGLHGSNFYLLNMNVVILQSCNSFRTIWSLQSVDKLAFESLPYIITLSSFPFNSPGLSWRHCLENPTKWITGLKRRHLHNFPKFCPSPLIIIAKWVQIRGYWLSAFYFKAEFLIKMHWVSDLKSLFT